MEELLYMKRITAVILAFIMAILAVGCSQSAGNNASTDNSSADTTASDNSWQKIADKDEFILGLDENFPPMGFQDASGNIIGFDIDLAAEVCKRLGITLKLQPIDWDLKDRELNTGNIDCIWNGFTIKEDRKKNVLFSDPYMKNRQVIVVKADSAIATLADCKDKNLGVQAGSSAVDALDDKTDFKSSLKNVVEFKDNMTALMDLEKGGVDAVLMDEIVARYYITSENKAYKVLDESLAEEEYGIGFRLNDAALKNKVQETLNAMAKDGKLAEISNKWFSKDITCISK
jgi:polar amino acid transport system substrate-binding protein